MVQTSEHATNGVFLNTTRAVIGRRMRRPLHFLTAAPTEAGAATVVFSVTVSSPRLSPARPGPAPRPSMRALVHLTLFLWLLNDAAAKQFTEEEMAVIR